MYNALYYVPIYTHHSIENVPNLAIFIHYTHYTTRGDMCTIKRVILVITVMHNYLTITVLPGAICAL